ATVVAWPSGRLKRQDHASPPADRARGSPLVPEGRARRRHGLAPVHGEHDEGVQPRRPEDSRGDGARRDDEDRRSMLGWRRPLANARTRAREERAGGGRADRPLPEPYGA